MWPLTAKRKFVTYSRKLKKFLTYCVPIIKFDIYLWIIVLLQGSQMTKLEIQSQMKDSFEFSYAHLFFFCFFNLTSNINGISNIYLITVSKNLWNAKKIAWLWDPYFLNRYALGITKMPKWKYSMCVLAKNLDFPILYTEKWWKFDRKMSIFSRWSNFLNNKSEINFYFRVFQIQ